MTLCACAGRSWHSLSAYARKIVFAWRDLIVSVNKINCSGSTHVLASATIRSRTQSECTNYMRINRCHRLDICTYRCLECYKFTRFFVMMLILRRLSSTASISFPFTFELCFSYVIRERCRCFQLLPEIMVRFTSSP